MNRVHFTSTTFEWATPQAFFDALDAEFGFTLDPCATPTNAKCPTFFTIDDDGLAQAWDGHVVFMNPPYGRQIGRWVRKARETAVAGATVVCLLPARTDTSWWHEYCLKGEVRFVRGRLKFGDGRNSAPFPSAVVVFRAAQVGAVNAADDGFDRRSNQLGRTLPSNLANSTGLPPAPCIAASTPSLQPSNPEGDPE